MNTTSYQSPARDDYEAPAEEGAGLRDQLEALNRRKWPMLAVFLTVLAAATAAAVLLMCEAPTSTTLHVSVTVMGSDLRV